MKIFSALVFLSIPIQALSLTFPKIIQDTRWFHSADQSASNFEFWRSAKHLGDKVNGYKENILKDTAEQYTSIADKINELKATINQVVTRTETMSTTLLQDVDLEEFQNRLEVELSFAFEELKKEFSEPLSEDQTERYKQQATIISRALNKTEDALVKVCSFWEIPETTVRTKFDDIKPHMNHFLLVVANLVNKHPTLFETLLISGIILIIPESVILQPILRFFGFGPLGPVQDSFAALAQRFFFGAVVKKGSWFAKLQRAGMKIPGIGFVTKIVRAIKCLFFWGC